MAKFYKSIERWEIANDKRDPKVTSDRITILKIAVRDEKGRFHGSTNFHDKN